LKHELYELFALIQGAFVERNKRLPDFPAKKYHNANESKMPYSHYDKNILCIDVGEKAGQSQQRGKRKSLFHDKWFWAKKCFKR
jgi:hypothetical protein